jgi:hypothetical protein
MSQNLFSRISLSLATLSLLLLSACSALPVQTEAEEIQSIADAISAYTIPEGYSQEFALDLMGYQLVNLQGPTPSCHIYLVQAPQGTQVDVEKLQEQARSMEGERSRENSRAVRVVEQRTATLRGEPVTLLVGEGANSDDMPYREITALFNGRGGPALISMSAPIEQWDWDMVDQFLASME